MSFDPRISVVPGSTLDCGTDAVVNAADTAMRIGGGVGIGSCGISTGIFGCPLVPASETGLRTVDGCLEASGVLNVVSALYRDEESEVATDMLRRA